MTVYEYCNRQILVTSSVTKYGNVCNLEVDSQAQRAGIKVISNLAKKFGYAGSGKESGE